MGTGYSSLPTMQTNKQIKPKLLLFPEPTVFDEAELSIYEELWDNARMITDKEIEPLAK